MANSEQYSLQDIEVELPNRAEAIHDLMGAKLDKDGQPIDLSKFDLENNPREGLTGLLEATGYGHYADQIKSGQVPAAKIVEGILAESSATGGRQMWGNGELRRIMTEITGEDVTSQGNKWPGVPREFELVKRQSGAEAVRSPVGNEVPPSDEPQPNQSEMNIQESEKTNKETERQQAQARLTEILEAARANGADQVRKLMHLELSCDSILTRLDPDERPESATNLKQGFIAAAANSRVLEDNYVQTIDQMRSDTGTSVEAANQLGQQVIVSHETVLRTIDNFGSQLDELRQYVDNLVEQRPAQSAA